MGSCSTCSNCSWKSSWSTSYNNDLILSINWNLFDLYNIFLMYLLTLCCLFYRILYWLFAFNCYVLWSLLVFGARYLILWMAPSFEQPLYIIFIIMIRFLLFAIFIILTIIHIYILCIPIALMICVRITLIYLTIHLRCYVYIYICFVVLLLLLLFTNLYTWLIICNIVHLYLIIAMKLIYHKIK